MKLTGFKQEKIEEQHQKTLKLKNQNNNLIQKEIEVSNETGSTYIPNVDDRKLYERTMSIIDMKSQLTKILKPLNKNDDIIISMVSSLTNDQVEFVYYNHPYIIKKLLDLHGDNTTDETFTQFITQYEDELIKTKGLDGSIDLKSLIDMFSRHIVDANDINNTEISRIYQFIDNLSSENEITFEQIVSIFLNIVSLYKTLKEYLNKTLNYSSAKQLNVKKYLDKFSSKLLTQAQLKDMFSKLVNAVRNDNTTYIDEVYDNLSIYNLIILELVNSIGSIINEAMVEDDTMEGSGLKKQNRFNKNYKSIGKYYINTNRLYGKGILTLRSKSKQQIKGLGSMNVTENVKGIIDKILKNQNIGYNDIDKLNEIERTLLDKIVYKMGIAEQVNIPTKFKSEVEKDINKYYILRGEIEAGNDNTQIIKDLKKIIIKLSNNNILPKAEVRELLLDIVALGY